MISKSTVALVTGANRGLGAQFVETLLSRGAGKVYLCARKTECLGAAADARVVRLTLDVTNDDHIRHAAAVAADVNLLINNAGINRQASVLSGQQPDAGRAEMEVNYFGLMRMAHAFAPVLIANQGAMVNVLSILARVGLPMMGSLCASKAAALRLSECLAAELGAKGVRVCALLPGAIDTDMSRDFPGEKLSTADVVEAALLALEGDALEVSVGAMADGLTAGLSHARRDVHRQMLGV